MRLSSYRLAALVLTMLPVSAAAQEGGLLDALRGGEPVVNLRLRNEYVDDTWYDKTSNALTLRTVLGYRSGAFRGVSLYAEAEAVAAVLDDDTYAAPGNGVTGRPTIADPVGVGMNQAFVQWSDGDTRVKVGRQEIVLGNARFVGNVGWRQNHQSYDAALVSTTALRPVNATYAFMREIHRVTGAQVHTRSHIADVSAELSGYGTLSLTGLLLDVEHDPSLSTATIGGTFTGKRPVSETITLLYDLSVATQGDAGDNPNEDLSALYTRVELGAAAKPGAIRIGRESLGGSPDEGQFTTTLATLHKFNGWADVFMNTPPNGLVDLYVTVSTTLGKTGLTATYHDFGAETGSDRYGGEIDLQVTYAAPGRIDLGAKLSRFMGDVVGRDVTKLWAWVAVGL